MKVLLIPLAIIAFIIFLIVLGAIGLGIAFIVLAALGKGWQLCGAIGRRVSRIGRRRPT